VNLIGVGNGSSTATATTATTPGAPSGLGAIAGTSAATVDLAWTAPTDDGGSSIIDYLVEYSSDSGSTWTTFSDGTSTTASTTVTGLGKGINYTFRVSAVNAAGTGTASSTVQLAIPTTVPGAPTNLTASATSGVDYSIDLAWTAPSDDGGSSLTDYIIEWQFEGGDWWTVGPVDITRDSMTDTSVTVRNLYSGGYVHVFRVTAINAVDEHGGDPSSTANGTPTGL
jgi:titin